ncbi:ribonuclease H-like domain-containing protein [Tanacetum coccineum]
MMLVTTAERLQLLEEFLQATLDESMLWHRRLGYVNFKTINKLVKENLVRGLPSKHFENDQTCVACLKGKQHKASCKSKIQNSITQPLFMLHMDLFGLTFVSSLMNKKYCLVVTDDYSRFTWVFFLATKDETSGILKSFITEVENLVDKKNRVLVVKPHNKTPYELFRGRTPALSFMRPFGCHVTILNTLDYLGKFDGKSDEGFFVGYSMNSKAFRVYNIRTRKVEENLHIRFLEDKPIIAGDGPKWLFDIDVLTKSMNYVPVVAGTNSNDFVGTKESIGTGHSSKKTGSSQDYILMPLWKDGSLFDSYLKNASNDEPQPSSDAEKNDNEGVNKQSRIDDQERPKNSELTFFLGLQMIQKDDRIYISQDKYVNEILKKFSFSTVKTASTPMEDFKALAFGCQKMKRTNRHEYVVPQSRSPTQTPVADEAAFTGVDVRYGGATTTVTGLKAGQGSGNIDKTPTMPQDSPLPRVNTLGSDEGVEN